MNLIYAPLVIAVFLVLCGAMVYYVQGYKITDNNKINKYKLSPNNILIRLKLFKYNNKFNLLLVVPYLITWNLFFVVLILYIVYWCGLTGLGSFFASRWVNFSLSGLSLLILTYHAFIRQKILYGYTLAKPNFVMEDEQTKDEKDKNNQ